MRLRLRAGGDRLRGTGLSPGRNRLPHPRLPALRVAVPDERASRLASWVAASSRQPAWSTGAAHPGRPGAEPGAVVVGIEGDSALAARLTAQGLAPGVAVHLVQRTPSYVIEVGALTLALEHRVALAIGFVPR